MASSQVKCQACGLILDESPNHGLADRTPCPRCRSTNRVLQIKVRDGVHVGEHVEISASGSLGSHVTVPLARLPEIRHILDSHGQRYWTDSSSLSINGQPPVAIINLWPGADVRKVEQLIEQGK